MLLVAATAEAVILGGAIATKRDMAWRRYVHARSPAFEVLVAPTDATRRTLATILHHLPLQTNNFEQLQLSTAKPSTPAQHVA
jgi:hypothetical protein